MSKKNKGGGGGRGGVYKGLSNRVYAGCCVASTGKDCSFISQL